VRSLFVCIEYALTSFLQSPGFLSAMARILFPSLVDMAYAASAPMKFYAQHTGSYAYYDHISSVAEKAHAGCAQAVSQALNEVVSIYHKKQPPYDGTDIGACKGTLPDYIHDTGTFLDELIMLVGYTFANDNMAYYPPSKDTRLYQACEIFSSNEKSSLDKVRAYLVKSLAGKDDDCFDMQLQLPTGPNATISGGDWSGVGTGQGGESWDFQTCTLLVETIAFGPNSMFPTREWTMDWLTDHCQSRFGVTPRPHELVDRWHFDDLKNGKHSNILFTNGLQDGWSVSGIQTNLSDSLLALNFPNGAHHSDLSHRGPSEDDTEDIQQGFRQIQSILGSWLEELPSRALPKITN
jgi:lysosomal Pro-X carboxypeptidase